MSTALEKGFDKFNMHAKNYYDLITLAQNLPDHLTVAFTSHIENVGTEIEPVLKLYTTGKLLDKTVNIDGLWSYNIYAERIVDDNDEIKFVFRTKTNGNDTCRAVQGCFRDKYIEPNLKKVIDRIKEFELTGEPEPEPEPTIEDSTLTNEVESNEDLTESEDNFLDLN